MTVWCVKTTYCDRNDGYRRYFIKKADAERWYGLKYDESVRFGYTKDIEFSLERIEVSE